MVIQAWERCKEDAEHTETAACLAKLKDLATKRVIGASVLFGVCLGCFTVALAPIPPDFMVDRLMADMDPKAVLDMMNKIIDLRQEHNLTFPAGFHFRHAEVALSAGSVMTTALLARCPTPVAAFPSRDSARPLMLSVPIDKHGRRVEVHFYVNGELMEKE